MKMYIFLPTFNALLNQYFFYMLPYLRDVLRMDLNQF